MSTIIKYGTSGAWLTYNGNVLNANATTIPPLSYRFRFESPQTASSLTGVGARGSWNRISDYIWDFTCDSDRSPWNRNFHYDESAQLPACHLVGASTTATDVLHQTFYNQDNIKSVYIQEAQSTQAFHGCDGIISFQMEYYGGDSHIQLDSAETIEFGVFRGTHVVAPNCTSLHIGTLTETEYDDENFSVVGSQYNPCTIVVDSMPNAVSIETMCQGGGGIGSIYLGHTDSLENCRHAFAYCTNLTQVHIDDMSNATSTFRMFEYCSSLTLCPAFDLSSCADMSYMFDSCTRLTACPDFTIDPAVLHGSGYAVERMYVDCDSLTSGAFDWYYKLTGDTDAYVDTYGHLPPDPYYQGPFEPSSETSMFEDAYSDEAGWPYINQNWK